MSTENNTPEFLVREYLTYDLDGNKTFLYGVVEVKDEPGWVPVPVLITGTITPFIDAIDAEVWIEKAIAVNAPPKKPVSPYAETCDGIEQEAWEEFAKISGLDMTRHPVMYLFLNEATNAARQAWKAGLMHATDHAKANAKPGYTLDQIERAAIEAEISGANYVKLVIALQGDGE